MKNPRIIYNKILQFISSGSKHLLLYNYIYINFSTMLSFVKNQKGGQNLVDTSGYQYRINKMEAAKDKAYWKCISFNATKCPASLLTVPSTNTLVKMSGEHNHSNKNIEQRVKNVINEAISSDSNY